MGFLRRLFGGESSAPPRPPPGVAGAAPADEQALARYRYLLRTAPPEAVEQAHAEAFAQLTPEQRSQVLKELSQDLPPSERSSAPGQADPQALARMATRAELRQPGILERYLGARGMGIGAGGMFAGSILTSIAGTFIGTAIAHQFLGGFHGSPEAQAAEESSVEAPEASPEEAGPDDFGDTGGADDFDGDSGDF